MSFESNVVEVSAMNRYTKLGKIKNKATIYDIVNANDELTGVRTISGATDIFTTNLSSSYINSDSIITFPHKVVELPNNNQGIFHAFVGTPASLGCSGNNIELYKVSFRRRTDNSNQDDNRTINTWLRLLVWKDNKWVIVFQSKNYQKTGDSPRGGLTSPWIMSRVTDDIINSDTMVAFTLVTNENAPANSTARFGARTSPNTPIFVSVDNSGQSTSILNGPTDTPAFQFSPTFNIEYSLGIDKSLDYVAYSNRFYEVSALSLIQNPHEDDYAVVNKYITSGVIEKTAYTAIRIGDNIIWKALDGNYDAENVYFGSNLIATENVGTISIPESGSTTVNVSGLNLQQALMKILAKEKYPSVSSPSVSIRFTNAATVEYGTTITPIATVSFNAGSYQYQPSTDVTIQRGTITTTNTTSSINNVGTFTFPDYCITPDTNYGGQTYTASVSVEHNAGITPLTNLGNNATVSIPDAEGDAVSAIPSGTITVNSSNSFSGYAAGRIYGYVTDNSTFSGTDASANTSIITNNSSMSKSSNGTINGTFTINVGIGARTIYIGAYGTGRSLTKVLNTTVNADMTTSFTKVGDNIPINGKTDRFTGGYTIWSYTPATPYETNATLSVTIG